MNDKMMTPEIVAKICVIGDKKVLNTLEHVQDRNFEVFEKLTNTLEKHTELIKVLSDRVITLEERIKELEGDNMDDTVQMCDEVVEAIESGNEDNFMDAYMKLTESLKQEVIEDMKNEEEMYGPDIEIISWESPAWALCGTTIELLVNGKKYTLENVLSTGGYVSWGEEDEIETGPWGVCLSDYPEIEQYKDEITELINKEIPWGCCGGCI